MNVRSSTECTLVSVAPDCRERIRNHSDEEIDEPEIQDDDADDEEEAGHKKLGVHHVIHQSRPLWLVVNLCIYY